MKRLLFVLLVFFMGITMAACGPGNMFGPTHGATPTIKITPTPPANTPLPAASTTSIPLHYVDPVDGLIQIIWASDPELSQYDPESTAYAEFPEALKQLSAMGSNAIDAASALAVAITFPRPDSYLAAQTIISLGPEITSTLLPILIGNLKNQKPEVRIYSVILLGYAGNDASCAVGDISPLLWDSDQSVRSAVALALERITEQNLVASEYEIVITSSFLANSISADTPEGKIVGTARKWWTEQGSKVNWHPSYDLCDP